jgi:hypothetical protein
MRTCTLQRLKLWRTGSCAKAASDRGIGMKSKALPTAGVVVAISALAAIGSAHASTYDDELSQVLATTPGQTYTLSFELAHDETDSQNDFSVEFGGSTVFSLVNAPAFGYTLETVSVTATSSSTTLAFFGREVPAWYDLDDVSVAVDSGLNLVTNPGFDLDSNTPPLDWTFTPATVGSDFFIGAGPTYGAFSDPNSANFGAIGTPSAVPEPATWAMMLLGFAGLGFAGYRRARAGRSTLATAA